MSVTFLVENAEDLCFAYIVAYEHRISKGITEKSGFMHCRFFQIAAVPDVMDITRLLDQAFDPQDEVTVFFCRDGDVMVSWRNSTEVPERLREILAQRYMVEIEHYMGLEEFFHQYDERNIGVLKAECLKKQGKITKKGQELMKCFSSDRFINTFQQTIRLVKTQRTFRSKPHILIVEDQLFSQKMMVALLKDYQTYVAGSSGDAFVTFIEKCPDIIFLDIELPDVSGHDFAGLMQLIDPETHIVMVTANNYKADVEKARQNGVKGYITKPYQKESILKAIELFEKKKKKPKVSNI